ncbi:MAG: exodeoxyribonuclease V subunit alpha [Acidimicrobiales bacterium]
MSDAVATPPDTDPRPERLDRRAPSASPGGIDALAVLEPWRRAGVLTAADAHVAATLARLGGLRPDDADVVVGLALAARAPRLGHTCLDLATVRASAPAEVEGEGTPDDAAAVDALPWPADVDAWRDAVAASPLATVVDVADPVPAGNDRPVVVAGRLVYLERYRAYEDAVAAELVRRAEATTTTTPAGEPGGDAAARRADLLTALLGPQASAPGQWAAATAGASGSLSVVVGGPGTGKTRTVAALLALLVDGDPRLRIALAAPTGKAAARMGETFRLVADELLATGLAGADVLAARLAAAETATIHRLLGVRPGGSRFRHDHLDPLPHDVVIVDETSMVSLPLMARLLDAVRPDARVVLVGDPGQLASVEAGSVLGDVAGPIGAAVGARPSGHRVAAPTGEAVQPALPGLGAARAVPPPGPPAPAAASVAPSSPAAPGLARCVHVLTESYRFPADSPVGRFAAAVRAGDADGALAVLADDAAEGSDPSAAGGSAAVGITWVRDGADTEAGAEAIRAAALEAARRTRAAAEAGDADAALAALGEVRILCGHRRGPWGVARWSWQLEQWLAGEGPALRGDYPGRPVLITANDRANGLFNGDLGVVVARTGAAAELGGSDAPVVVAFPASPVPRCFGPSRLEAVETVHAMTIHKSQGSEFDRVVVVLPPPDSRLATRELLYTAITRARLGVTLVGSEAALRAAVERRVVRASGLGDRLWPASRST